jgi:uncharacterized membrane protein
MIQCHALSLLRPELRNGPLFDRLVWLDGLVAPSFIFSAGFSLALVQVRSASSGTRFWRVMKTLRRLGEVIGVAYLGTWMFFPIRVEPKWLLRIDILHCIGISLLIALPITAALARRPTALRFVALGLAAIAFGASPVAEQVHGGAAWFLNTANGSAFPLLPWAGYVYLGASAGALAANGDVRALVKWIAGLAVVGLIVWKAAPLFIQIYPPHNFWVTDPANHAERWLIVCLLLLALLAFELRVKAAWRESLPVRFVQVFGMSSLAAYFFHETLLYYWTFGFSFHRVWGERCSWTKYAALTALLIGCAFVLAWATDKVYRYLGRRYDALVGAFKSPPVASEAPPVAPVGR